MTRMTGPDCVVMCNLINTHTHTRTQLTIVTNIIEHEFVATAILYFISSIRVAWGGRGCCQLSLFAIFFLFSRPRAGLDTV